jgi:hypothetical protein
MPETLIRYQERPLKIKKIYRAMFKISINFDNKFMNLTTL